MSCSSKNDSVKETEYTCPMHPTVISDKPSTCPVCGMDLVRKAREGEEMKITEDFAKLLKSPSERVVASVKTIKAEYKSVSIRIEAMGLVTYDTRSIYTIPARAGGRLEKIFLKSAFQSVGKGVKVAEIYSPELITAQRELLYVLENDAQNTDLIQSAKSKLSLLGLSDAQVNELIKRKEVLSVFTVYSPYSGYLVSESQQAPAMSAQVAAADGMNAAPAMAQPAAPANTLIREGNYVSAGQTLFKVVSASALRIELNLPVAQAATLKSGQSIQFDFRNGRQQTGTIDFIQPFFNEGQEFVKIRAYTTNTGDLHIGHLVHASMEMKSPEGLWVPKEAVLDLGTEHIVFIKDKTLLKPKKITTGIISGTWVEVKQGLASSDEVAANAQYLVDSESFIKAN